MVIRKIIISFITFICLVGCCYNGIRNSYGLPRKKIKPLEKNINYEGIDTLALYEIYAYYGYNNISKEPLYFQKASENSYPYLSYLKFYKDGKLGLFVISKDSLNLNRDMFNPKKAKMGYYYLNGNKIKTKISTIGNCDLYISNGKGFVYQDTIKIENNTQHGSIYVKKNIPKQLLENWKPDW